jgi:hypothetical protein
VVSSLQEGEAITISGTLNLTGGDASLALTGESVAVTDLKVYCVSFSIPPVAGTGAVAADGSFSLSLAAAQVAVGCFILDSANEQLGTMVFENPAKKNLDGSSKTDSKQAFAGNVALGAITLDVATGKAVVDVSQIAVESVKDTSAANATAFDFSGSYVITSAGVTLPDGYSAVCPPRVEGQEGGDNDCNGPSDGEPIWVKRINGTSVADGSPVFGIMVWESEERFEACGSKLGMTYADARANAGVELNASGIAEGAFDWAADYDDGWKSVAARAKWDMMKMENVQDFYGYRGMKQYFWRYSLSSCGQNGCTNGDLEVGNGFMFNADTNQTGCRLADNTPYQMNDWGSMNCTGEQLGNGLHKSVCSRDVGDVGVVTCTHIGGAYRLDGTPLGNAQVQYPDDFAVIVQGPSCSGGQMSYGENGPTCVGGTLVEGQLCSEIDPQDDDQRYLLKLRCYADGLWERAREDETSCIRDITTNWSATRSEDFLEEHGPVRAMGEHIFEGFNYDSPNSGSFSNEEVRYQGIRDGNNWTDCKVIERFSMSLRKMDDSGDLLAEMVSETRNASFKPACVAEYGEPQLMKSIFKLERQ